MADDIQVTIGDRPASAEAAKKVSEALKKTLQTELANELRTAGGAGATPMYSGHAKAVV